MMSLHDRFMRLCVECIDNGNLIGHQTIVAKIVCVRVCACVRVYQLLLGQLYNACVLSVLLDATVF